MNEIYASHHRGLITWLCIVRRDPHIRKCVNRDVARKIAELVRVVMDENVGLVFNRCGYWGYVTDTLPLNIDWSVRPCHNCMQSTGQSNKYCSQCSRTIVCDCVCMIEYRSSIDSTCFDKIKHKFDMSEVELSNVTIDGASIEFNTMFKKRKVE